MAFDTQQQGSGVSLKLTPLYHFIIGGIQKSLQAELGMPVAFVTSTDKVYAVRALFRGDASAIRYPYATLRLVSLRMAQDRGAVKGPSLRGTRVVVANDELTAYNQKILPVDYIFSLSVFTTEASDLVDSAIRMLFARVSAALNQSIQYGHTNYSVKVEAPDTYDIPERNADSDQLAEYTVDWELIAHAHVGYPQLQQVQIANVLDIESSVASGDTLDVFSTGSTATPSAEILSVDHPTQSR